MQLSFVKNKYEKCKAYVRQVCELLIGFYKSTDKHQSLLHSIEVKT